MTTGTGIAGAMSYQPRETNSAPNECATCGKDFGEGGRTIAAAIPGIGLVQYCSRGCAPTRSPAEEWEHRRQGIAEALDLCRRGFHDSAIAWLESILADIEKGGS